VIKSSLKKKAEGAGKKEEGKKEGTGCTLTRGQLVTTTSGATFQADELAALMALGEIRKKIGSDKFDDLVEVLQEVVD
jgi:hypothetical protein